jgi:hypothetical protein
MTSTTTEILKDDLKIYLSDFIDIAAIRSLIIGTVFDDAFIAELHSVPVEVVEEERKKIKKAKIKTLKLGFWDTLVRQQDELFRKGFKEGYKESYEKRCRMFHEKNMEKSIERFMKNEDYNDCDNSKIAFFFVVSIEFVESIRLRVNEEVKVQENSFSI